MIQKDVAYEIQTKMTNASFSYTLKDFKSDRFEVFSRTGNREVIPVCFMKDGGNTQDIGVKES